VVVTRLYVITFLAEILVIAALAACYRLAGVQWGDDGFSQYVLLRRTLAFALPVMTLGLEIGVPFHIAASRERPAERRAAILRASAAVLATTLGIAALVLLAFPGPVALLLFGDRATAPLVAPLAWLMVGFGCYTLVYAYERGTLRIARASALYVLCFALLPPASVLLFDDSAALSLERLGQGVLLVCLPLAAWALLQGPATPRHELREAGEQVLRYSLPRMLQALALMAIFALPALATAHLGGVVDAGRIAFAVSLVGMAGSAFSPIGVVMLPHAADRLAAGEHRQLREQFRRVELLALAGGVSFAVVVALWAGPIARFFSGGASPALVLALRLAALGGLPYAYYIAARALIDAGIPRGVNARNAGAALLALLAVGGVLALALRWDPLVATSIAFTLACGVLGVLTFRAVREVWQGNA
jgi:O-antigen/teichoic acid export membrane protein